MKDYRIFQLSKYVEPARLEAIVAAMITDLDSYLDFPKSLNAAVVVETAELILEKFRYLSLTGIQDAFNRLKLSEPPFDYPLYNKLSGPAIMKALRLYEKEMEAYLFEDAERNQMQQSRSAMDNPRRLKEVINNIKKRR